MIYLTYNDPVSGVYRSQVMDVVRFISQELNQPCRLVALVSIRGYGETKKQIKAVLPDAVVLPMVPKARNWSLNHWLLRFLMPGKQTVLARGVFATLLANRLKKSGQVKKVAFDGRGAYAAEWEEYNVCPDAELSSQIRKLEKEAVLESDAHLAVTTKLIEYWQNDLDYKGQNHVVIPCTLMDDFMDQPMLAAAARHAKREELGIQKEDVALVYCGSAAGWQSFELLEKILSHHLDQTPELKVVFLSKKDDNLEKLEKRFPGRVKILWVKHQEVFNILQACDYGILIREETVTNRVASPTKMAEYLAAGLPVLISENLGDYSDLVKTENCGSVVNEINFKELTWQPNPEKNRHRLRELAHKKYRKRTYINEYKQLIHPS